MRARTLKEFGRTSRGLRNLRAETDQVPHQFIGHRYDSRIRLEGTLIDDHAHKLAREIDVGLLERTRPHRTEVTRGRPAVERLSRDIRLNAAIAANADQALEVREYRQTELGDIDVGAIGKLAAQHTIQSDGYRLYLDPWLPIPFALTVKTTESTQALTRQSYRRSEIVTRSSVLLKRFRNAGDACGQGGCWDVEKNRL